MTPQQIAKRVVVDRLSWIERMVAEIRALPLHDRDQFFGDSRNVWTAESCLRRGLEAALDLGRHILAKQDGGPIALVQNGDQITIDAKNRTINMAVSDEEIGRRRAAWTATPYKATRGTLYKYIKNVKSASEGCVTDE